MSTMTRRRAIGLISLSATGTGLGFRSQDEVPTKSPTSAPQTQAPIPKRRLGKTDMVVSVVGFGGLPFGLASTPQDTATELLNRALDNGLNFIDTAECYGHPGRNQAEDLIGAAVSQRREEYFVCTKVGHENGSFAQGHEDWSETSVLRTMERSLKRLKTDRLDLVYLHGCDLETLKSQVPLQALRVAQEKGMLRYIGYSGSGDRARFAIESGDFDVLQVTLNVFEQDVIEDILPLAQKHELGVVIKRPLGNAVWRFKERPEWWYYQEYWDQIAALDYEFFRPEAIEVPGPNGAGGVALRFVTSTPGVHTAIVGTRRPGRWSQNNANVSVGPLSEQQWRTIRRKWRNVAKSNESADE